MTRAETRESGESGEAHGLVRGKTLGGTFPVGNNGRATKNPPIPLNPPHDLFAKLRRYLKV